MKTFLKILSMVALVAWCVCFALGYNFREGGNLTMSIVLAFFLFGLMAILIFLMTMFSKPKNANQTRTNFIKEMVSVVCYLVFFGLSITMVAQFITVETKVKSKVQPLAIERIDELYKVFAEQEEAPAGSYWAYLDEKAGLYEEHVKNTSTAPTQDQRKQNAAIAMNELLETLLGNGQFEEIQNLVINFLQHCEYSVENWVPWTLPRYLGELDTNLPEWENTVIGLSTAHAWTQNEPYTINSMASDSLLEEIKHPEGGPFTFFGIILIIVMQVVIILPYFVGRDWSLTGPGKGIDKNDAGIATY